jgi:hypothetical protein
MGELILQYLGHGMPLSPTRVMFAPGTACGEIQSIDIIDREFDARGLRRAVTMALQKHLGRRRMRRTWTGDGRDARLGPTFGLIYRWP